MVAVSREGRPRPRPEIWQANGEVTLWACGGHASKFAVAAVSVCVELPRRLCVFARDSRAARSFNSWMVGKSTKQKPSAVKKRTTPKSKAKANDKGPVASRPVMPAGYGTRNSREGLLNWTWARERLTASHNYVIVTVRPDGRPHAMGMHGLWFEDNFYFGTGDTTRKAKNLAANSNCIIITEQLDELIIVEGTAKTIRHDTVPRGLSDASKQKYGWPVDPGADGVLFKVEPRIVFALPEKQFATALTRWKFQ